MEGREARPRYVMVTVEGHAPVTECLGTSWQATCPCGWYGDERDSVVAANEDRFRHEEEIGARVQAEIE